MTEVPFNPAVKDGRGVRGLAVPKSNWANTIDTPPFEAYAVTCGLTFTFGGLKITTNGEVESTDGHVIPACSPRRAGRRAVLSQLPRRHRPGVRRGDGQDGRRRCRPVREGQELGQAARAQDARGPTRGVIACRGSPAVTRWPSARARCCCPPAARAGLAQWTGHFRRRLCRGGGADINARELGQIMSPMIGQQIVVDNKGGAAGSVGCARGRLGQAGRPDDLLCRRHQRDHQPAHPEGHDRHADRAGADLPDDLVPVRARGQPKVPANTAAELVALAKKEPDKLTFSSSGVGGNNHLAGALFAKAAGIKLIHVPYKGTGPALADVISGQITMNFSSLPPAVSQIRAGNLRGLAVTGEKRISTLPDVPTLKEQGIDVVVTSWHGLFAPAKTPADLLDKIDAATKKAMKDPKWEAALGKDGLELPPDRNRADFAKFVAGEHAFWGKTLKELNVEME
jgi:tripartite-type tricarboxylate transporter receptor subunit TctC